MADPALSQAAHRTITLATPVQGLRFVTAASLFDGHDASINIMRRILQSSGAEVIHLGHNRSVAEVVRTALQEDAHGIAVSSYQGGHVEYFQYMVDMLRERGGAHIKVFGGGGGVIVPEEIETLHRYGVTRIYSPADGQKLGLQGMIDDMLQRCQEVARPFQGLDLAALTDPGPEGDWSQLSRLITQIESGELGSGERIAIAEQAQAQSVPPVVGITGTGGSGKSSLTDELILRFGLDHGDMKVAVLAVDPTRRKTGGALLGDRIGMNAIYRPGVYMRSLATRVSGREVPESLDAILAAVRVSGFDLVVVETSGIGQGDVGITAHVDLSLYVMTPEFGAASQLEKIDMLDFADLVAINKFDRKGAEDALRDVRKQVQRNREDFSSPPDQMPVYATMASRYNDDGVNALYHGLVETLASRGLVAWPPGKLAVPANMATKKPSASAAIVPPARARYLAEVAETVRLYHARSEREAVIARERQQLAGARRIVAERAHHSATSEIQADAHADAQADDQADAQADDKADAAMEALDAELAERERQLSGRAKRQLDQWPEFKASYAGEALITEVRGRELRTQLKTTTLSGTQVPKVALPRFQDHGDLLRWLARENVPGSFPYTAGVFSFKREGEDPARMFAGEGDAFKTNERFKLLSEHAKAKRLSTAFDSVTLYGFDPARRPDIYGKVGNSGVSIATLEDMKVLYEGFDLGDPLTSVSMTINGPAPTILAMFLNTAIDQRLAVFSEHQKREPSPSERQQIRAAALAEVRGTVQADILKEDQGQNTCIFSTEFSLKLMGDIQAYFIEHKVRNFYSVSISGYHIAEAGANPISQLAFTLANAFTYVEAYLARGMDVDDFAPNLSFFFSNGMDAEYTVMGRVARRIWAVAMREKYGGNERSQKLKYHIQTSGRSLHAQEMTFNDIRTTLQALVATYDNCNSLHTNAYDEAVTTPSVESVRRALAIQLIVNKEWGLAKCENPNQGAYIIEELTDLVEEAVLQEFERIAERGGVLGAMETGYQRGKIQDESIYYEHRKHDGSLPIVGVNTFISEEESESRTVDLARSTEAEKEGQLSRLATFHDVHAAEAPVMLARLRQAATNDENVFAVLMEAVRCCSLGQITDALFEVGGRYRRNM